MHSRCPTLYYRILEGEFAQKSESKLEIMAFIQTTTWKKKKKTWMSDKLEANPDELNLSSSEQQMVLWLFWI